MRQRLTRALGLGALGALLVLGQAGCSSDGSKGAGSPTAFDDGYFDRLEAARAAERAAVMHAGLWDNQDGTGRRFAVILPASARYATARESLITGLMAGYWADNADYRARLIFYNEEQYGTLRNAYRKAIVDGAEVVIGPLPKESVQQMIETTAIGKHTIALNAGSLSGAEPRLYQFSLSVEEEAVNAARAMFAQGYRRAFLLYEDDTIGDRAMRAFSREMLRIGGGVVETVPFSTRRSPYEEPARRIAEATYREKLFSANPKEQRYLVYRRGDVAFIAGSRNGIAGMTWALRQAGVQEVPIVATSHANAGEDSVAGVYVVDLPWEVDPRLRAQVWARAEPELEAQAARGDSRLVAMGLDSYRLAQNIEWMTANRQRTLDGVTGTIRIDDRGRVDRKMAIGKVEGLQIRPAELPAVDPKTRRPIAEVVVRDGVETVLPVTDQSASRFVWRNPFSGS